MMRILFYTLTLIFFCNNFAQSPKVNVKSILRNEREICTSTGDSQSFHYQIRYPWFYDEKETRPLTDSLNKYVRIVSGNYFMDSTQSFNLFSVLTSESDSILNTWKSDLKNNFCYNLENTEIIEREFADKKFQTLSNNWYAYDGGAHGVGGVDYIVLETKTGKKLNSWKLLFADTAEAFRICKEEFYALKKRDQCEDADWFWGGDFYLTENFGVFKDGILFYYQAYEIAPYAFGPTEMFIGWDRLKKAKPRKK